MSVKERRIVIPSPRTDFEDGGLHDHRRSGLPNWEQEQDSNEQCKAYVVAVSVVSPCIAPAESYRWRVNNLLAIFSSAQS